MLRFITLVFTFITSLAFSQTNFSGINIQGQILEEKTVNATIDLSIIVLSNSNDTVWFEKHLNTNIDESKTFTVTLGHGNYISGNQQVFNKIDWLTVSNITILTPSSQTNTETTVLTINPVPFSLHSLKTLSSPSLTELSDTPNSPLQNGATLKYNDSIFTFQPDNVSDSTLFALYSDSTNYTDTALTALYNSYSDSSILSLFSDTSLFSHNIGHSTYSDSSSYAQTTTFVAYSTGNWGLNGNSALADTNFIGTIDLNNFNLTTNNSTKLSLNYTGNITNDFTSNYKGFSLKTPNGALFDLYANNQLSSISTPHLYTEGHSAIFRGGAPMLGLDSLRGLCSFSWGENVGTNGKYSTIFGKNSYGDSSFTSSSSFDAISSFAFGNNCRTTRMGVAIGKNCIAGRYRNVAIGKDVTASTNSSSIGLGNNVISTGATAWAAGKNISASGHFSTALGKNASTNFLSGSFVFGDNSTNDTVFNTAAHQFLIRSANGVIFYSSPNSTMGTTLNPGGGSWNMVSDKNMKTNITEAPYSDFIKNIENTPIYSWQYKDQPIKHISPMAQDFNSNFRIGELKTHINMLDIDGVTLMGIKNLNNIIEKELDPKRILSIEKEIEKETKTINDLERRINLLYEKMDY